jgi:hypothetical protein
MGEATRSDHGPRIVIHAPDALLHGDVVTWATERLRALVRPRGIDVLSGVVDRAALVLSLTPTDGAAESYVFSVRDESDGLRATVSATDERGFAYAINELADRIAADGLAAVRPGPDETDAPAAAVRSICRSFANVHHDLQWFRARAFWPAYLDHLAAQRFNRFHLAFGMQCNYGSDSFWSSQSISDNYLCFPYPFLVDVPGFHVRAQGVTADERARNLAALAFIARETRRRSMSFQLGLWNHAYDYGWDAEHWYPILGIAPETHADYCAAAIAQLLEAVPEIEGVTFRVHYEGGISEHGRQQFWTTVFDAVASVGRSLCIDLHAKGVDEAMLDAATRPNLHLNVSPKYAAEHTGLPYHQASIRPLEAAQPAPAGSELMGTAEFARRFTRYGYGDFLDHDRGVDVVFRMWPGTQRFLLWGDPAFASGYGRCSTFGGARGLEYCEPLLFKGRKGSGVAGGRDPYVDDELQLGVDDWRKYEYTYVLWGRLLYDPDADPDTWRRPSRDSAECCRSSR